MRNEFQINGLKQLSTWANSNNSKAMAVEIGAYAGEGTLTLSNYFNLVIAVDPWLNGYDKNDLASEQVSMDIVFKKFIEKISNIKNIKYIPAFSKNAIKFFNDQSIDFLYIDGDYRYEAVINDIALWTKKIKKNGIISGHDFSFKSVNEAIKHFFPNKKIELFDGDSWGILL